MILNKKIGIFPFPFGSGSNLYINLLYSLFRRGDVGGATFDIIDCSSSFIFLLKNLDQSKKYEKNIIHIHWATIIYGSRFMVKSLALFVLNFSILLFLKKIKKYKICWTMHNYFAHDYPHPLIDKIGRNLLFKISDRVIIQQKKEFQKVSRTKKDVYIPIGNYINAYGSPSSNKMFLRNKFDLAEEDIILLSLGLVRPYKRIENIIKNFAVSANRNPKLKLVIAGNCKPDYCRCLTKLVGQDKNIFLDFGFIEDQLIPEYLAGADFSVFWFDDSVLTSAGLLLSLSYGVPAIIRNITASELIHERVNGFIYDDDDELRNLLLKLDTVKFDKNKIMESVSQYSQQEIAYQLSELYKTI